MTRFINCEVCQTEGRILTSDGGPYEIDNGVCPACRGKCEVEVEDESDAEDDDYGRYGLQRRPAALYSNRKNSITDKASDKMIEEGICPHCGGDCSAANPPVYDCPMQQQRTGEDRS